MSSLSRSPLLSAGLFQRVEIAFDDIEHAFRLLATRSTAALPAEFPLATQSLKAFHGSWKGIACWAAPVYEMLPRHRWRGSRP